jgi:hypothetical protein
VLDGVIPIKQPTYILYINNGARDELPCEMIINICLSNDERMDGSERNVIYWFLFIFLAKAAVLLVN